MSDELRSVLLEMDHGELVEDMLVVKKEWDECVKQCYALRAELAQAQAELRRAREALGGLLHEFESFPAGELVNVDIARAALEDK